MKHSVKINIFFLFFLACIVHAMKKPQILKEITTIIKNPTHIMAVNNDKIAIGGSNGFGWFNLNAAKNYTWFHGEQSQQLIDFILNKSKTKIGISRQIDNDVLVAIHDLKTDKFDMARFIKAPYVPITFNAENDEQLIAFSCFEFKQDSSECTFCDKFFLNIYCPEMAKFPRPISCHPTECIISYMNHDYQIESDGDTNFLLKDCNPCIVSDERAEFFLERRYSPDGKFIVTNSDTEGCLIQEPGKEMELLCKIAVGQPHYISMEFLSGTILALFGCDKTIQYWDCVTKKQLACVDIKELEEDTVLTVSSIGKRIAFFPDGRILVALENSCFVLNTPFNVLYQAKPDIQKQIYIVWALQNYGKSENDTAGVLPYDIVWVIGKLLPSIFRI
jgi:hypothetical protein